MYQDYLNCPWSLSVRIFPACPSPVPNPPVLAHLHSESAATITDRPSELIYMRLITMYQYYFKCLRPLSVQISSACPSPVPSPPVLAHLHSKSTVTVTDRQTK
jgi:hypothetical protein